MPISNETIVALLGSGVITSVVVMLDKRLTHLAHQKVQREKQRVLDTAASMESLRRAEETFRTDLLDRTHTLGARVQELEDALEGKTREALALEAQLASMRSRAHEEHE